MDTVMDTTNKTMKPRRFSETVFFKDIPDTGLEFQYEDLPGLLEGIPYCSPSGAIYSKICLMRRGKNIWAEGTIQGTLSLTCYRCLNTYGYPLSLTYSYLMIPRNNEDHLKDEICLKPEELEVSFFDGVKVELFDIFREQILLGLPVKQLCSEDCKGLCPECGRDLNLGECSCQAVRDDNPFIILRKLKYA